MKRKGFKLTTSGVTFDDTMPYDRPTEYEQPVNAEEQFGALLMYLKKPKAAFIQKHSTIIDRFISAVARGINKKPEDLVLDPYGPFIEMLKRWATNYKASKNIPKTSIRLGGKFLLRGDETEEEQTNPRARGDGPTSEEELEEFFAGTDPAPGTEESTEFFAGDSDVPPPRRMATQREFEDAYFKRYPELLQENTLLTDDSLFLNYLRYVYEYGNNPSDSLATIVDRIGVMLGAFTFDIAVVGGKARPFKFEEFFLERGIRFAKTIPKSAPTPEPVQPTSQPAPSSQPKIEYSSELLNILKGLLEESADASKAAEFVSEYEYTILPKRYSEFFFGPDLVYGIGQSMQRLREAYKFSRSNDELFVDFLNDEQWRDLFITLVVQVINLQQKISSFNAPQSIIRMLENNAELTVGKFSGFKRFHRTQPRARRAVNF
jgi:hypothetical protein